MKKEELSAAFWQKRYIENQTGWNIGYASTPIVEYINQLEDKSIKILIPGAGNAYEAEYLYQNDFKNVFVLDIAQQPLKNLKVRMPDFPSKHLIHQDFFKHREKYDLIIEQTFFCALHPSLRQNYADHMFKLLNKGGKLVGLWFNFPADKEKNNPPYTGTVKEYEGYFKNFKSVTFNPSHNSIPPRAGKELFGIIAK